MAGAKSSEDSKQNQQSGVGGNDSVMFLFAYLLSWISGIIVLLMYGERNKRLKFHAMQSILYGIGAMVVVVILDFIFAAIIFSTLGFFYLAWLALIPNLIGLLLWLYGMYIGYQGYTGKDIEIPFVGPMAKQHS
jgi:uncharacterized membrane protein